MARLIPAKRKHLETLGLPYEATWLDVCVRKHMLSAACKKRIDEGATVMELTAARQELAAIDYAFGKLDCTRFFPNRETFSESFVEREAARTPPPLPEADPKAVALLNRRLEDALRRLLGNENRFGPVMNTDGIRVEAVTKPGTPMGIDLHVPNDAYPEEVGIDKFTAATRITEKLDAKYDGKNYDAGVKTWRIVPGYDASMSKLPVVAHGGQLGDVVYALNKALFEPNGFRVEYPEKLREFDQALHDWHRRGMPPQGG